MYERQCNECFEWFEANDPMDRFCSQDCEDDYFDEDWDPDVEDDFSDDDQYE